MHKFAKKKNKRAADAAIATAGETVTAAVVPSPSTADSGGSHLNCARIDAKYVASAKCALELCED